MLSMRKIEAGDIHPFASQLVHLFACTDGWSDSADDFGTPGTHASHPAVNVRGHLSDAVSTGQAVSNDQCLLKIEGREVHIANGGAAKRFIDSRNKNFFEVKLSRK